MIPPPLSHATPSPASPRRVLAAALLLALAALAAYVPSFSVPLFFDDQDAIIHNPTIRDLSDWTRVLAPPADGGGVTGRPLVNLSLALDYAIGGTNPRGYHLTNFFLHTAAAFALLGLLRRTFESPALRARFGRHSLPLAAGSAGLWALHPLQTESVTCIIQRTEVLAGFFYLLTLYAVARAATEEGCVRWSVLAVLACLLGMASKEVMVSAPLTAWLYDRTFFAGSFAAAARRRRALYAGLGATWLLLAGLVLGNDGSRGEAAGFGLGMSPWHYLLTQCHAIVLYLRLALWPFPLVIDYGSPLVTTARAVLPEALLLTILAGVTIVRLRRRSASGFLLWCFFALLAPSSSIVPLVTQTLAEHRMYLPLAVPLLAAAAALHQLLPPRALAAAALALTAALGTVTLQRNRLLADEVALWRETVARVPANPRAHDNLASALVKAGRPAEAVPHFERALRLNPRSAATYSMLGDAWLALDRPADAEICYRGALALAPAQRSARQNLAVLLHRDGRLAEAREHYALALAADPEPAGLHRRLGLVCSDLGDLPAAIGHFESALRLTPRDALVHADYARTLAAHGRTTEARRHFERSLALDAGNAVTHVNLSHLLLDLGDPAAAARHSALALGLQPELAEAHNNQAIALFRLGRTDEAIRHFERALALQPDYAVARENLARLRATPSAPAARP